MMYICALGRMSTRFSKCKRCPAYFYKSTLLRNQEKIKPIARAGRGKKINIAIVDEMHEYKPVTKKEVKE
ncbi:MAG: hypothetical protein IJ418_01675 [Clostridia bacterium]|nr:hypothetical protein [Clostridia bacterium]